MSRTVVKLITAWQMVVKRGLSHWRLLSSVVLGVLLASAIMAGTVVYFDALSELALKRTLAQHTTTDLDILVKAERGPTTPREYGRVSDVVVREIDTYVDWMLRDRVRAGKTATFFLTAPGLEHTAGDDNARSYFAFFPRLLDNVSILPGGRVPNEQFISAPGEAPVLEALIPLEAAQLFGVGVGDRLVAVPPWSDAVPWITVVVSGIFQRNDPTAEIWHLERGVLHAVTGPSFRTAPFYVTEKTFMEQLGRALRKMDSAYGWLLTVDTDRLHARNSTIALADLRTMESSLGSTLSSYLQITVLDSALEEFDRRLFFSKLPMFVVLILIAVVILYYVATLSSLVVEERRSEIALLRSRGATSTQVLTVFVLEGATIAAVAIAAGPVLAAAVISVLGYTPAFSDLTGGGPLAVSLSSGAYMMSALGGLLSFVALIVPAVQASRIGVTRHRQEAARPTMQPAFQRYYFDVLLLLLSIFLFRELTEQGSVLATNLFGELAVSQLLLALPGLILLASAMVLLRLFPVAMNLASRLMASWLPAGLVLGMWQMARNPTHYARLSLLLILTAGLGIFASSFGATLDRSFTERVLYDTGSEIRVDGVRPVFTGRGGARVPVQAQGLVETYEAVPGVDRASPVLRDSGRDLSKIFGASYVMLAMDQESFSEVAWFRDDFSHVPMKELLASLKPTDTPEGVQLPEDARSISVRLKADRAHPSVRVTARIKNSLGRYTTYSLGNLSSGSWMVLDTSLRFGTRQLRQTSPPLKLVSLRINETSTGRRLQAGSIIIDEIRVTTQSGQTMVVEPFDDAEGWNVLKATDDAKADALRASDVGYNGDGGSLVFSWSEGRALSARGIFHGPGRTSLPILASQSFVRATGHPIGEEFEVSVAGHRVPVRLVDTIDLFPTMTRPNERFLVADLTALTQYANLGSVVRELRPNEMWISTAENGARRSRLVERLEDISAYSTEKVHDRDALLASSKVDPLVKAGWRALLFVAFASVLILSCLGFLVHAYVSFQNRQLQFALLRTVGFSLRQLTTMVWLEQALVIAVGMALGTWMGSRLGETIMPFLSHDDSGSQVLPPFVMQVNWGGLLITYGAMVAVFALIILGLIWLIRRISLQRILRLGEM